MILLDFDSFPADSILPFGDYGGNSCGKSQLEWRNATWMVKYPSNRVEKRKDRNKVLSYDTSPISEWLGSHVYQQIGLPVQETVIGVYQGRIIVACKHIYEPVERLLNFRGLMRAWREGTGYRLARRATDRYAFLNDIYKVIDGNFFIQNIGLKEHFWNMFVVDMLIGNHDRNTGNWGIIQNTSNIKNIRISPVFDNASSFFPQWTLERTRNFLKDRKNAANTLLKGEGSPFLDDIGNEIHPIRCLNIPPLFKYKADFNAAMQRIVPRININSIFSLIGQLEDEGIIAQESADLYRFAINVRYEMRILPYFEKHCLQKPENEMRM